MSISIIDRPNIFVPVYNSWYFVGTSTNINQPEYNFIFDIFTGQTGSNSYATRIIAPPDPTSGNFVFSPFKILENYITYDLPNQTVSWALNNSCAACYEIAIGEQYSVNTTTGVTQYSGLTTVTGTTWNAALQYQDLPNYTMYSYLPTGGTTDYSASGGTFLTYMPNEVVIRNNEQASISVALNPSLSAPQSMRIVVYQASGGTRNYYVDNTVFSATTKLPQQIVQHFGSGLNNINQLTSGNTTGNTTFPVFNYTTDYRYSVQVMFHLGIDYLPMTRTQFYIYDSAPSKYETVRLMWINSLGGADYFTFTLVDRTTFSNTKSTYKKVLPYKYSFGQRGVTVLDSDIQQSRLVNSNWVDDQTAWWLYSQLKNSPEVYEMQQNGNLYPIIITETDWEAKQYLSDQELVQVEVSYNYAYKNVVQRG